MARQQVIRGGVIVALASLLSGCSGCDGFAARMFDEPAGGGAQEETVEPNKPIIPGKAQLRLLNGEEYRNTVRDLLELEASDSVPQGELASGYDTGNGARVDENALSVYVNEAERLAGVYVATKLSSHFDCYDPANVTDECVKKIISVGGFYAFRRPVDPEMQSSLESYFAQVAADTDSRPLAVEFVIARLLSSPYFLYRSEAGKDSDGTRVLDPFERASLISYAVTGSMPDAALFKDASDGVLDEAKIREHVRRLLATEKGKARVVTFMKQWLKATALDSMAREPDGYPKLTSPEQGAALRDEFAAYVTSVVFDGTGTLPALLKDNHTFVNRHTAPLYGLSSDSDALTKVELDGSQRKGLLTLASLMAVHGSSSDGTADRPVRRGLVVLNRLLCGSVGAPSGVNTAMAASNVKEKFPNFDTLTVREQYEAMMEQGSECKSCHKQFMPLGFALGNFDGLGRHVTTRFDRPINTSISDMTLGAETLSFQGAMPLVDTVAALPETSSCFARNYATFAIGTPSGEHLDSLVAMTSERFTESKFDIKTLIEDTLASPHLYTRRPE